MIRLPDSPRFRVIDASEIPPQSRRVSPRPIYVYLPEEAERNRRKKFPVLYCQDGQNLWDDPHCCFGHGGWYLNHIVDQLTREGEIEPIIVVGIPNSDERYRDYAPGKSFSDASQHAYAAFVCGVKFFIDENFPAKRTRRDTALLGSSLGGLVSLWLAHSLPETFGKAACLSGAFQVRDRERRSFAEFVAHQRRRALKIYLDSGTVDDGAGLTRKLRDVYLACGWQLGHDLLHVVEEGAEHNERFWRGRVWQALTFLFGVR